MRDDIARPPQTDRFRGPVQVTLHRIATLAQVILNDATATTTGDDISQYVESCTQTNESTELLIHFSAGALLTLQPKPGHVISVREGGTVFYNGIVDNIPEVVEERGTRRMKVLCRNRDGIGPWRNKRFTSQSYPISTPLSTIVRDIITAQGVTQPEYLIPQIGYYVPHINFQFSEETPWKVLTTVYLAAGYTPFTNAIGQLSSYSRDVTRQPDVVLEKDKVLSIQGSKSASRITSVKLKWLNNKLTKVVQQSQVLANTQITAGFFTDHVDNLTFWSEDRRQRAQNTFMEVLRSINDGLLPVGDERYDERDEFHGEVTVQVSSWVPILSGLSLATLLANAAIPDGLSSIGIGVSAGSTIPIGRIIHASAEVAILLTMMSLGTANYNVWGQPYDFVHARNTTEAYDRDAPSWAENVQEIENDLILNEVHAQATAVRELVYEAASVHTWGATILDDPRLEPGDIVELPDRSRLYITGYSRTLTRGEPAELRLDGFRVGSGVFVGTAAGDSAVAYPTPGEITVLSTSSIQVNWTVQEAGSTTIVQYGISGSNAWASLPPTAADATSATITGLQPDRFYDIRLIAVSTTGQSPPSPVTSITLGEPAGAPPPPPPPLPGPGGGNLGAGNVRQYGGIGITNWTKEAFNKPIPTWLQTDWNKFGMRQLVAGAPNAFRYHSPIMQAAVKWNQCYINENIKPTQAQARDHTWSNYRWNAANGAGWVSDGVTAALNASLINNGNGPAKLALQVLTTATGDDYLPPRWMQQDSSLTWLEGTNADGLSKQLWHVKLANPVAVQHTADFFHAVLQKWGSNTGVHSIMISEYYLGAIGSRPSGYSRDGHIEGQRDLWQAVVASAPLDGNGKRVNIVQINPLFNGNVTVAGLEAIGVGVADSDPVIFADSPELNAQRTLWNNQKVHLMSTGDARFAVIGRRQGWSGVANPFGHAAGYSGVATPQELLWYHGAKGPHPFHSFFLRMAEYAPPQTVANYLDGLRRFGNGGTQAAQWGPSPARLG